MLIHALIILAVVASWLLSLLAKPFAACWLCRGKGIRRNKRRRKARKCWLCKGKKRRQRVGSRIVHRVRRNAAAGWRDWRAGQ